MFGCQSLSSHFEFLATRFCHKLAKLENTDAEKEELVVEADFYDSYATGRYRSVSHRRSPFATRRRVSTASGFSQSNTQRGMELFERLIPIFDRDEELCPLKYDPTCTARDPESLFMSHLRKNREALGERPPVTVGSLQEFQTNFNRQWPNVLHRIHPILLEEPVIIAGGSVLQALTASKNIRTGGGRWGDCSDIDLFLYCQSESEGNRVARRIFYALAVDHEAWVIIRARGVINIHCVPVGP